MVSRNFHHILPPNALGGNQKIPNPPLAKGRGKTFDTAIMSFQTTSYCLSF